MSELKPIPRALRKRPAQAGYDVVATDKGWFGVAQGRKNSDAILHECKDLYTKLEELELLTPNDVYYREHSTLQIVSEALEAPDEDETPEVPEEVETETTDESDEATEVESDDEKVETQDEPEEDKSAETTDVPQEEPASEKPTEKPELEPLETLETIDEKVLANYPAETVKAFAKDLDLGEFSNRKLATAAILDFVKG